MQLSDYTAVLGIDPAAGHPERALALGYTSADARPAIAALFALDASLGRLARGTRDPLLAQMRLAWWREALERLDQAPAPAQPILRALAAEVVPRGVDGTMLARIVDGWDAVLGGDAEAHGRGRGAVLFAMAALVLGAEDTAVKRAGEGWGLADLAVHSLDREVATQARLLAMPWLEDALRERWSAAGRALGALALVGRMDLAGGTPGSPRRVARLAWFRLTGR